MSSHFAANFISPNEVVRASRKIHRLGIRKFDVHTPYPLHGLDEAMGIGSSHIPWIALLFGLLGAVAGISLQGWTSAIDWPLIVAGKPFFSWPAFIPITFEVGILLCAFGTLGALFFFCRLPKFSSPLEEDLSAQRSTNDQFMIIVDKHDPKFEQKVLSEIFEQHHGLDIRWLGAEKR
ncbi:MAG: DUF3341 domain-containing protein [Deltaproteobacteria bacterium]|nr:DUF3341 domain-containing protein [Deltaproteobacteria bacterium]